MQDYNLDNNNSGSSNKRPDAYCNLLVTTSSNGSEKLTQVGKYGIALDKSRKLDSLIIKMAQENPDALAKLILSIRVTLIDETSASDEMELVLA